MIQSRVLIRASLENRSPDPSLHPADKLLLSPLSKNETPLPVNMKIPYQSGQPVFSFLNFLMPREKRHSRELLTFILPMVLTSCVFAQGSYDVADNRQEAGFDSKEAVKKQTEAATALGMSVVETLTLPGNVSLEMRICPAGEFPLGSPSNEKGREKDEALRIGRFPHPFYLNTYPLTQEQYFAIMQSLPTGTDTLKAGYAARVSYAQTRQELIPAMQKYAPKGWRMQLVTVDQMEYATRAGTLETWYTGSQQAALSKAAWHKFNSGGKEHPVGQKLPNAWGFHDTLGNVWQWTTGFNAKWDKAPGPIQVVKGGAYNAPPGKNGCRSANVMTQRIPSAVRVAMVKIPEQQQQQQQLSHQQRLELLKEKIEVVSSALEPAEGFPKKSGQIDLQTAKFFFEYLSWELQNPEITKDALMGNQTIVVRGASSTAVNTGVKIDSFERDRRYQHHINAELTGSMQVLDQALARLEKRGNWPVTRDINWSQMKFKDGYFRINERPVFSGGFNVLAESLVDAEKHPEWAEKDKTLLPIFLKKMQALGVGIVNFKIHLPSLVMKDGSIDRASIQTFSDTIQHHAQLGFQVDVRFGWDGDNEVLEHFWPGLTKYFGHSVPLDIDHPGAKIMTSKVLDVLLPELQKHKAIVSWDMANEPGFYLNKWSPYGLDEYHAWLAEQYQSVQQLNAVWKTSYSAFEAIPLVTKNRKDQQCSAGEWYDRVTFQNRRVTRFFGYVQSEIRKYFPDATIHMKAQDNSSLGPKSKAVTDGIDREMLTPYVSLQGVDTRPLPVTEPRMAARNYDESIYGFHWLGQSFLYDYLTSLVPQRSVIDFEYHAFSINKIRIPDMPQKHSSAALWLAHLHGQISNVTWYWHRRFGPNPFPHGKSRLWFYGSISTQPLVAAEYFQTMMKLNAFSEEVEALATHPIGPVRILVSKPSYIQNQAHIDALHRVYEATCFSGLRVGFVTEQMLEAGGVPDGCKLIIVPDAQYVSAAALNVLDKSREDGVRLVRFGERTTAFDQHGLPHAVQKLEFLKDVRMYQYAAAPELFNKFHPLLAPYQLDLPVQVSVENRQGAFGIIHRQAQVNGEWIVLLVNVSDKPVKVQLQSKDGSAIDGYDMLAGEAVTGDGVNLSVQDVKLIKVAL